MGICGGAVGRAKGTGGQLPPANAAHAYWGHSSYSQTPVIDCMHSRAGHERQRSSNRFLGVHAITRKLSYRKADRAMRPLYALAFVFCIKPVSQLYIYMGALKIFGCAGLRPRLLFPKFLTGFCSD